MTAMKPTASRGSALAVALALLTAAAAAVLWAEDAAWQGRRPRAAEFQRLVGGLGFGPAADLSGCPFGFDPRLEGACARDDGPVPGGSCFCPRHAGSVLYYPPLDPGAPEEGLAPPP
jgi:hypothetical protein